MMSYAAFNSISVISRRQLTLFMSFLGVTSSRLGLSSVLPKDTPTKNPEAFVPVGPRTPWLRVKHFTTEPCGTPHQDKGSGQISNWLSKKCGDIGRQQKLLLSMLCSGELINGALSPHTHHIMFVIDFWQATHHIMQHQGVAFRKVGDYISDISDWFALVYIAKEAWQPATWLISIVWCVHVWRVRTQKHKRCFN